MRHLNDIAVRAATDTNSATTRLDDLTTRVVLAAAHLDQHGRLPPTWPNLTERAVERTVPDIEISILGP